MIGAPNMSDGTDKKNRRWLGATVFALGLIYLTFLLAIFSMSDINLL